MTPIGGRGRPRWLVALSVLAVLGHLLVLYLPGSPESMPSPPGADKVVHVGLFALPVWLLGRLTGRVWLVGAMFALHGVLSELVQWQLIPYRSGDLWDLVADMVGVGAGAVLAKHFSRPKRG